MNFQKLSLEQIQAHAVRTETQTWRRFLDDEELRDIHADIADRSVKLLQEQRAVKELQAMQNRTLKQMRADLNDQVDRLRDGFEELTGDVYLVDDQEAGLMHFYDESGTHVGQRRLMASERQQRLFPVNLAND